MRLGYFGGTFDPPHLGHLAVAQAAADAFALDRVLLVPTGIQPLKRVMPLASYEHRLAMVELLCGQDARMAASDMERPRAPYAPNYTIDTLERLKEKEPQCELFVIVGADAFAAIRQWREPERLLAMAEWIVVTRPSLTELRLPELTAEERGGVHVLRTVAHPASATAIREGLTNGDAVRRNDIRFMLPTDIQRYIEEHHLYEPQRG